MVLGGGGGCHCNAGHLESGKWCSQCHVPSAHAVLPGVTSCPSRSDVRPDRIGPPANFAKAKQAAGAMASSAGRSWRGTVKKIPFCSPNGFLGLDFECHCNAGHYGSGRVRSFYNVQRSMYNSVGRFLYQSQMWTFHFALYAPFPIDFWNWLPAGRRRRDRRSTETRTQASGRGRLAAFGVC